MDKRNDLVDAVMLADVKRVAKRLLDGMLVTTVGPPPPALVKTRHAGRRRRGDRDRGSPDGVASALNRTVPILPRSCRLMRTTAGPPAVVVLNSRRREPGT